MILWKVILGVILFVFSTTIAGLFPQFELIIDGTNYAPAIIEKILDVFAASLLVWGILKNPTQKKTKWN